MNARILTALAALSVLLAAVPSPVAGEGSRIRFTDATERSGITIETVNGDPDRKYIIETLGSGAALFDFDLDGDLDLYIANGSLLEPIASPPPVPALYANKGDGTFKDVTAESGLAEHYWGFGVAAGDYDNDGDPDLYITAYGPNRLYRNDGGGRFTEVASAAGVDSKSFGTSAAFLDYDADGAIDLYVANYVRFDPAKVPVKGDPDSPCLFRGMTVMCGPHGLTGEIDILYHNNGDGTFTNVSEEAGIFTVEGYFGLGVITIDIDGDARTDILVANDSTPNQLYRNLGGGRFVDEALMAGFAYSNDGREQAGMGIDAGDIDGDGDMDVYVTNFSHDYSTLRINNGMGLLEDSTVRYGMVEPTVRFLGWGTLMIDIENDGDLDIFKANGHVYPEMDQADIGTTYLQRNQVFENFGPGVLREVDWEEAGLGEASRHRGLAGGDVDGDGDIDLVVTIMNGRPRLLINESVSGAWILVRLVGRRSARDGLGARVIVEAGGRKWVSESAGGRSYLSASDPRLHFGIGDLRSIDAVRVRWPSGTEQTIKNPPINRILTIEEETPADQAGKEAKSRQ